MTVTDTRRRPSPQPRTENPTVVTERATETCNADPAVPAVERQTTPTAREKLQSAITVGNRVWVRSRDYWTPPALLTEQPPTLETLTTYARNAAYANKTGVKRAGGIIWCYTAAIPALVRSRVWAWLWERPGRFFTVAITVKCLSFLPPVAWAVDHLITPATQFALWLFI